MSKLKSLTTKIFLLLVFINTGCSNTKTTNENLKFATDFFPEQKVQVLVVGTFHFGYPGMDERKTENENKIDILSEPKKSELTELINYIKLFQPNKIAIEALPNWNANIKLQKYLKGEFIDQPDERFQIGMRIAKELNIPKIHSVDAVSFSQELSKNYNPYLDSIFMNLNDPIEDGYTAHLNAWDSYDKKLPKKVNLLKYFKHMNSAAYHKDSYGRYLLKNFKYENQRGADLLSLWWYNRNLRIFRKIQKITANEQDRILVLIGNGHAAVLRQLIQSSPEYEFIEFENLKKTS